MKFVRIRLKHHSCFYFRPGNDVDMESVPAHINQTNMQINQFTLSDGVRRYSINTQSAGVPGYVLCKLQDGNVEQRSAGKACVVLRYSIFSYSMKSHRGP